MAVNTATLELITEFEGFVDHWYPDPAHGWSVPTCCYGHTDAAGAPKYADTKTKRFSKDEALIILARDLAKYEGYVDAAVKVPLTGNQRGALVSFTFNLGPANLNKSTLLKKLNRGDYDGAAAEFGKWVNAAGKKLPGLVRRREAERKLFLSPDRGAPISDKPAPAPRKSAPKGILALVAVLLAALYAFAKSAGVPLP